MCNYNFKFMDSQPLKEFMKDKRISQMKMYNGVDGIRYAIGDNVVGRRYIIPLASTVSGLHLDLNVCWVTNPYHREHPHEYVLLCRSKFADVDDCDLTITVSVKIKTYGK